MTTDVATDVVQLQRERACTRCPLHEECKTVCIPTTLHGLVRSHKSAKLLDDTFHSRAILVIGEAPGSVEDLQDRPFVGPSGHVLRELYIKFFKLPAKADVYYTNGVRCRPEGNRTPNKTQLRACHPFLLADVVELQRDYDEVVILATGAVATRVVWNTSLKAAFQKQGDFTDWHNLVQDPRVAVAEMADAPEASDNTTGVGGSSPPRHPSCPEPCRVFSTYHPQFIRREPSMALSVKRHVQMLADYLDGNLEYELDDLLDIAVAPSPPEYDLGRLSLDIETYGIVTGYPKQRYFHPRQSHLRDYIAKDHLVQTVGLTWKVPAELHHCDDGGIIPLKSELRHAVFLMDKPAHRRRLWAWLRKIRKEAGFEFLLGQNIAFDLMYLRYAYKEARALLEDPLPIMDLMVLNYLHDESRPERSLKALAPLFRVSRYKEFKRYDNSRVPELLQYNCQDTASTLRLAEKLMSEIKGFYGKDTKKLSPFCMKWYSQLLWLIVWMSENGIHMDQDQLVKLFNQKKRALEAIMRHARECYNMPLRGKGSEKAKRAMMNKATHVLEEERIPVPELELTDKKGEVRFSADNRNALMDLMDRTWSIYKQLRLFGVYQDISGLMDRYLYPLLVGGGKKHDNRSSVLMGMGLVYPKWFPVPSEFEDRSAGGTKQARIVAKAPPIQTFPPPVKKAIAGRFRGGWMLWFDYSQIELRVAALLSNDPAMMKEYQDHPDLHGDTAKLMFGDDIVNHPDYKSKYRQAGKTFNFRALYRGGAKMAQTTLMKDLGIPLGLDKIAKIDNAFWKKHARLREWQGEVLKLVQAKGFFELPLIGQSRLFLGGKKAKEKKLNEIVNLPVQAIAADIMLSAQYVLWSWFRQAGLRAIVPCNIYDAGLIECPKYEIFGVRRIMAEVLPNPPFYQALCDELGRTLPLEYEVKENRVGV